MSKVTAYNNLYLCLKTRFTQAVIYSSSYIIAAIKQLQHLSNKPAHHMYTQKCVLIMNTCITVFYMIPHVTGSLTG